MFGAPVVGDNGNVYLIYENISSLVELDLETGALNLISDGLNGGTLLGAVYDEQTNTYTALFNNTDPNFVSLNLTTLDLTFQTIDSSSSFIAGDGTDVFSAPVIDANGNVKLIYENLNSIMDLNIETGAIDLITDGFNGGETIGAVYNSQTNEYIAFYNNTDPNYVRVNLETLELNFEAIDSSFSLINGDGTDVFSGTVITN